jgi:enoyl-CoA hydratase/carnithine racemase
VEFEDITYSTSGGIARITINRPERRNALRIQTYEELAHALELADADGQVGVVVLTGAGDTAFSSGGDLSMAQQSLTTVAHARTHSFQRMLRVSTLMTHLGKPVVCAVNGLCIGGGAELICFADFVVASEHSTFTFNGTKLGGCSWWGAPQLLPMLIGLRRAEELLYLSSQLSAQQALDYGLINRVVAHSELTSATDDLCNRLLDLSAEGLRQTKAALRSTKEVMLLGLTSSAETNASAVAGPELQQAFEAFLEKKPFNWRSTRPGLSREV